MTEWTPDLLKQHYDERLSRLEADLIRKFDGFPQEYATITQQDVIRQTIEEMRIDHVHRRELEEIKAEQHEGTGRRTTWALMGGAVVALLLLMFGLVLARNLTAADVSNQIQREAPWNADREEVIRRIINLENENENLRISIIRLQQKDEFFCVTRTAVGLPGC